MADITDLRRIENDTPASATDVDFNFQVINDFFDTSVVNTDGSNAMTGDLVLSGAPTLALHAATKAYVDGGSPSSVPTGAVIDFAGASAPSGYVLCDGTAYSSTDPDYLNLFNVIGTTFGDPGGGNFNVPDMRDASSVGPGATAGAVGATGGDADTVVARHLHTIDNSNHRHSLSFNTAANADNTWTGYNDVDHTHYVDDVGSITNNVTRLATWPGSPGEADIRLVASQSKAAFTNGYISNSTSAFINYGGVALSTALSVEYGTSTVAIQGNTGNQSQSHRHDFTQHNHEISDSSNLTDVGNTENAGVLDANTNYHPFVVLNKMIKL